MLAVIAVLGAFATLASCAGACNHEGSSQIAFNLSDVLTTNRFGRESDFAVAQQYSTTKLVWVYTLNSSFVQAANRLGWTVQAAANGETPDVPGSAKRSYEIGRIRDVHGNMLTAPWMRDWTVPPYWGCVNNPAYVNVSKQFYELLIGSGSRLIQHDDPFMNLDAVSWEPAGCFCDFCDAGFTSYLNATLTAAQLKQLGISTLEGWSYRQAVLNKTASAGLHPLFADFQSGSVVAHYHAMRDYVDELAGEHVPWSSNNNGSDWEGPIYTLFEAGVAELYPMSHCPSSFTNITLRHTCAPADLIALFSQAWAAGRQQAITIPKFGATIKPWGCNITAQPWYRLQIRRVTAVSYAVGGHMITPYDIYEPDNCPRFYGDPGDYADVFSLVRAHPSLFDGWTNATAFSPEGQGGGNGVTANATGVYVYWRCPDPASERYDAGARMSAVVHVVDYRGIDPSEHPGVALTLDVAAICGGSAGRNISTTTVYSTSNPAGRMATSSSGDAATVVVALEATELDPWAFVAVACTASSL